MEAATEAPTQEAMFLTKYPDHKLIMENARQPYTGPDGRRMPGQNGRYVQFKGNSYSTSDPEELEFLRNHDLFNTDIWEFGRAPGEPQPTVSDQMKAITSASVDRDAVALKALIDSEQSTHNRAPIIEAANHALTSIAGVDSE